MSSPSRNDSNPYTQIYDTCTSTYGTVLCIKRWRICFFWIILVYKLFNNLKPSKAERRNQTICQSSLWLQNEENRFNVRTSAEINAARRKNWKVIWYMANIYRFDWVKQYTETTENILRTTRSHWSGPENTAWWTARQRRPEGLIAKILKVSLHL